jgi:hypothetical protein
MKTYLVVIAWLSLAAANANAAALQPESCDQVRAQINAQVGVLPKVNTDMLHKLSSRPDCRFTAAEVYRSAYGDKPMPKNESRGHRSRRHHHDDD